MTAPLDICLVSPGMAHDGSTLTQRSLGGSETAAICVARALAAQGHQVTVFSPGHTGGVWDGVTYRPLDVVAQYLTTTEHDLCIISRDLGLASMPTRGAVKFLWCHDLALKRFRAHFTSALWDLDAVLTLSGFQHAQYAAMHDVAKPVLVQSRNGVDLTRFPMTPLPLTQRDQWRLVYGSRPERGLETMVAVMRLAAMRGRPWKLYVSSYDNPVEQMREYYEHVYAQCRAVGNIVLLGAKTQAEWTKNLSTARAMVYPGVSNDFREISFLCGLETQACGTPYVACAKGALPETLHPAAGMLLGDDDTDVTTPAYAEQFLAAIESLTDATRWQDMGHAGHAHAQGLSWAGVAAQWVELARGVMAKRVDNAWRLERHFRRNGDVEAAEAAA